ncbi:MAG: hypothetical protein ACQERK_01985 [Campylobacterota bacterium]
MRKSYLGLAALMSAFVLFLTGCGGALVQQVDNSEYLEEKASLQKMEQAIKTGGMNRGWKAKKVEDGHMVLEILVRGRHYVAVDVFYDQKGYTIEYKESRNMSYNPTKETIHGNYNKWVHNLERDINHELAQAGLLGI